MTGLLTLDDVRRRNGLPYKPVIRPWPGGHGFTIYSPDRKMLQLFCTGVTYQSAKDAWEEALVWWRSYLPSPELTHQSFVEGVFPNKETERGLG